MRGEGVSLFLGVDHWISGSEESWCVCQKKEKKEGERVDQWISGSEESWGKLRREGVEYLGSLDHWIKEE